MIVVYESVHLVIRSGGITSTVISERGSASARGEDVELVALRVGQARPRHVALAEVDVGGAECSQPGHLRRLIVTGIGPKVEMDAVLHGLHVGRAEELEIRSDTLGGAQHRAIAGHLVQGPVHRLVPEPGHGPRAQSTVTAATGPVSRPPGQGASTQNSLPSGSARTVHETSPWPTSAGVAPRSCRRATRSARWAADVVARSRCTRFFTVLGSGTARTSMQTATGSG